MDLDTAARLGLTIVLDITQYLVNTGRAPLGDTAADRPCANALTAQRVTACPPVMPPT